VLETHERPLKLIIESYRSLAGPTEEFFDEDAKWLLSKRLQAYHSLLARDLAGVVNFVSSEATRGIPVHFSLEPGLADLYDLKQTIMVFLERASSLCHPESPQSILIAFLKELIRSEGAFSSGGLPFPRALRIQTLRYFVSLLLDPESIPSFYDVDHLDELDLIICSRYLCGSGERSRYRVAIALLGALCEVEPGKLAGNSALMKQVLLETLGDDPLFRRARVEGIPSWPQNFLPNVDEEFTEVNATRDYHKYLQLTTAYSQAQRQECGTYSNRPLSLIRGYERDHHAMLRLLVSLKNTGQLTPQDNVLVIGPRHRDEIVFFREYLGLTRTIGLDLFEDPKFIIKGDMHNIGVTPGFFKLIYTAACLDYSYYARKVIDEMARAVARPGFILIADGAGYVGGPTPLARSDHNNVETLRRMFYKHNFDTLLYDEGRSPAPNNYVRFPCLGIRLHDDQPERETLRW